MVIFYGVTCATWRVGSRLEPPLPGGPTSPLHISIINYLYRAKTIIIFVLYTYTMNFFTSTTDIGNTRTVYKNCVLLIFNSIVLKLNVSITPYFVLVAFLIKNLNNTFLGR